MIYDSLGEGTKIQTFGKADSNLPTYTYFSNAASYLYYIIVTRQHIKLKYSSGTET